MKIGRYLAIEGGSGLLESSGELETFGIAIAFQRLAPGVAELFAEDEDLIVHGGGLRDDERGFVGFNGSVAVGGAPGLGSDEFLQQGGKPVGRRFIVVRQIGNGIANAAGFFALFGRVGHQHLAVFGRQRH